MTALRSLRQISGLTRREVSELCGINLRSLQDYEQGHKDISHAKGELLYKLSMTLGCTVEDLLEPYLLEKGPVFEEKQMLKGIREAEIKSETYKVYGKWIAAKEGCMLVFVYRGMIHELPFSAIFTEQTLPWLRDAAVMKMESYIENELFQEKSKKLRGDEWDEW